MGLSQILMMVLVLGGLAAYWWFKTGRHGGTDGYLRKKLATASS